jgi:hypothetical protein
MGTSHRSYHSTFYHPSAPTYQPIIPAVNLFAMISNRFAFSAAAPPSVAGAAGAAVPFFLAVLLPLLAPCRAPINAASPSAPDPVEFFLFADPAASKAPKAAVALFAPFVPACPSAGVVAFLPPSVALAPSEALGVIVIPALPPTFVVWP